MIFDTSFFLTAKANMAYDNENFGIHKDIWIRAYEWQQPGITYPKKRRIPDEFCHMDQSERVTGGGIVLHSPGDVVITVIYPHRHRQVPTLLKDRLIMVRDICKQTFESFEISLVSKIEQPNKQSIQFCKTYFSPYELYLENQKVVGLTLKRSRTHSMIHGIIHLKSSAPNFTHLGTSFHELFAHPLPTNVDADDWILTFKREAF